MTRPKGLTAGIALLVLLVGLGVMQSSMGKQILRHLGVATHGTPFTSLSFSHAANLPASSDPNGAVTLAFTIDNEEGSPRTYKWQATSSSPVSSTAAPVPALHFAAPVSGTVQLDNHAQQDLTVRLSTACRGVPNTHRVKVVISLTGQPQQITHWLICAAEPR